MNLNDHLLLFVLWILWCVIHSTLISRTFMRFIHTLPKSFASWHRLIYVLFSIVTFFLLLVYQRTVASVLLWEWVWPWKTIQLTGLALAAVLFISAAVIYDQAMFFGLRQLREKHSAPVKESFRNNGVPGIIRHPYYAAGILILVFWGDGSSEMLPLRIVGTLYFFIGAALEEKKLIAVYGDKYRLYRNMVPGFIPRCSSLRNTKTKP